MSLMKKGNRDSMFQRPKSEPSQEQEKNNKVNTWNFLEKTMHLEALLGEYQAQCGQRDRHEIEEFLHSLLFVEAE